MHIKFRGNMKVRSAIVFLFILLGSGVLAQPDSCMMAGDSVNCKDINERKQGLWRKRYPSGKLKEQGVYVNSRKEGLWKEYYESGGLRMELIYKNGRPLGYVRVYYESGFLREEGVWKNNRWAGDYCEYYENGCIMREIRFNSVGKREVSKYYDDKNCGEILKVDSAKAPDNRGIGDPKPIRTITRLSPVPLPVSAHALTITGCYRLYSEKGLISKEGDFVDHKLVNGIAFYYDEGARLKRVARYKEGKYIGDMPVDSAMVKKGTGMLKCVPDSIWNSSQLIKEKDIIRYNKRILFKGVIDDRCLVTGKEYTYDKNGVLTRIAVYKDGKYIGDAIKDGW